MEMNLNFENTQEEFIRFIRAIEAKFDIRNKEVFEDDILKLIRENIKENVGTDIDKFENTFFEIIRKHSSLDLSKNIEGVKKEMEFFKDVENGE